MSKLRRFFYYAYIAIVFGLAIFLARKVVS